MQFVSQTQKPIKVRLTVEHFGGRTSTHYVVVGRAAHEGPLAVQNRADDEYRRKHGYGTRIVAFGIKCGE
jgi:hypothetical protein